MIDALSYVLFCAVFISPWFMYCLPCRVLDESLQKALHRYLEVRGFKHSLHDWLYEYMMRKDEKEYVVWLKNMKEFIGGN
jgi:complement component 1 Q subcomponent-binding protein